MPSRRQLPGFTGLVIAIVIGTLHVSANAQVAPDGPIAGIRISQAEVMGAEVRIDVSVFYSLDAIRSTAYLGNPINMRKAIFWGDGAALEGQVGLPLVATSTVVNGRSVRAYRGSFSHTYGNPGSYEIKTASFCCAVDSGLITGFAEQNTYFYTTPYHYYLPYLVTFGVNFAEVEVTDAPLFADGFESGDVSAWSDTSPGGL